MNIIIKTIPHKDQRYETCGDYWWDDPNTLQVRVSNMKNPTYEWFVAEHEINEALLCKRDGVSEKIVSEFDISFEELRKKHPDIIGDQEPGNMISAPYNKQHLVATDIEWLTCNKFGETWVEYNKTVDNL